MHATRIALLLALTLAACASSTGRSIDGWEIGAPVICTDRWCDALVPAAQGYFDRIDPGHAPIVDRSLHAWPPAADRVYSSGPPRVVVLRLADGSFRAFGVKYAGVDTVPSIFTIGDDGEPRIVCNGASCS